MDFWGGKCFWGDIPGLPPPLYESLCNMYIYIIESVDSISRDEADSPLTQYITNAGISRARYTHTFHPLSTIVIQTLNFAQVKSMDDNCGEWVECMGVASGCGEQEAGVASGSGWNLWVWL